MNWPMWRPLTNVPHDKLEHVIVMAAVFGIIKQGLELFASDRLAHLDIIAACAVTTAMVAWGVEEYQRATGTGTKDIKDFLAGLAGIALAVLIAI